MTKYEIVEALRFMKFNTTGVLTFEVMEMPVEHREEFGNIYAYTRRYNGTPFDAIVEEIDKDIENINSNPSKYGELLRYAIHLYSVSDTLIRFAKCVKTTTFERECN